MPRQGLGYGLVTWYGNINVRSWNFWDLGSKSSLVEKRRNHGEKLRDLLQRHLQGFTLKAVIIPQIKWQQYRVNNIAIGNVWELLIGTWKHSQLSKQDVKTSTCTNIVCHFSRLCFSPSTTQPPNCPSSWWWLKQIVSLVELLFSWQMEMREDQTKEIVHNNVHKNHETHFSEQNGKSMKKQRKQFPFGVQWNFNKNVISSIHFQQ